MMWLVVAPGVQERATDLRRRSTDMFKLVTDHRGVVARAEAAR